MKSKNILFAAISVLLTIFIVTSCGKADVSGVFIPEKKSQIKSIEFKDGKARISYSFIDFTQGFTKCRFSSSRVFLDDPMRGEIPFKIIDGDTILCEHPAMTGTYKRRE